MNVNNQMISFEDARWSNGSQKVEYRHTAGVSLLPEDIGSMLDIGCGEGTFLSLTKNARKDVAVSGMDFSKVALQSVKKKVPKATCVEGDVTAEFPFPNDAFDLVSALDVLEHTLYPEKTLREIKRVTKKYVLLSVPNFNSFPARMQTLCGNVPENNRPNKGHVYWFNLKKLQALLSEEGLEVVELRTNHQLQRTPLIKYIFRAMNFVAPSFVGLSFVLLAKKHPDSFDPSFQHSQTVSS